MKYLAHGTFIGSLRLDPNKPQQVFVDSELKFGASTRTYIIRERPQLNKHFPSMLQSNLNNSLNDSKDLDDSINMSNIAALPESEAELDVRIAKVLFFSFHFISFFLSFILP